MNGTMKAVICTKFGGPEVLKLKQVKKPLTKDNEILIRIRATTVTGSDVILRRMNSKKYWLIMHLLFGFTKPRNPMFGFILSGEIEATGKNVHLFKKGDRVFGATLRSNRNLRPGTYAEYKCLPEDAMILPIPSGATFEEAAALPYGYSLALGFLKQGGIQHAKSVLIYGASGSAGTAAVQLAKYYGAHVTGVCSTANLELVKSLGADKVIDYTKQDVADTGQLYDLVFDSVPFGMIDRSQNRAKCEKLLTPDGRYISIDDKAKPFCAETFARIKELYEEGKIKPVIGRTFSLEQIPYAHQYVETGHKLGNAVIIVP